ncbi:hypothetical protein FSP39_014611 [Pinctada imbricata]|uniref:Tyrosine specific protein phosphatases domain-containing protein n=1 Tax=Pinctada imbricata TaxID=66713 RepID=A0AA88XH95_PINIB|nr:hypothetical protein FSP39_014611 [Pinctada imbricata]
MEATGQSSGNVAMKTLPNFRRINSSNFEGFENERKSVYRSSRPDCVEGDDLKAFHSLGIRTIVDCRSKAQYLHKTAEGPKHLDNVYKLYSVKLPKGRNYHLDETVTCFPINHKTWDTEKTEISVKNIDGEEKKHFLINFFPSAYGRAIFMRAPWYIKILGIFVLLFDTIFRTSYIYFVRLFALTVINKGGLKKSYEDMIELSQASICAALKIVTREEYLPVLINCAHGKDRTGILSALILSVLGESEEEIVEDYGKTQEGLAPIRHKIYKEIVEHFYWDESFCDADPDTMRHLLQYIKEKYGSVKDYLVHIGFTEQDQENLRRNLTSRGEDSWVIT